MPLTPPKDNSAAFSILAAGIAVGLVSYCLTRYSLPIAGDHQHRFPFGGCYQDGNKKAAYFPHRSHSQNGFLSFGKLEAFITAIAILATLLIISRQNAHQCQFCGRSHN
ncbi:triple gene block protein 2 [Cucumber vein-clearing virus]|uniref:Movement protein TGB2 n=1 Tax=Cucumber vein-clearing virus TaxID=1092564 RepID=G5D8V7_9VIRU|nr:triple gene block protein 2 [Cucumber vein-clearing virus]AEP83728.1 triple gene block protein 2 [Cucumber vein-clearing virus]WOL52751.1 triple gene block protein 2 [Cucumber vein-clearing virus]